MLRGIRILSLVFVLLFPVLILAQTGSISGNVTDEATSLPLPGVHLAAIAGSGPHPHMTLGVGVTDSNGNYTIHNLPAAVDYFVAACKMGYQCEFYDNATTVSAATLVPVTDGATTPGIDFALAPIGGGGTGTISGTVTDSFTGQPIAGAKVLAHNNLGMHFKAYTDSSGHYSMTVPAGSYALVAWAHDYHPSLYPGIVNVGENEDVIVDFQLVRFAFGAIAGNVTDSSTGNPIFHALQIAKKIGGRGFGFGFSDSSGNYLIDHLPVGFYHVASLAHGYHFSIYPDSVEVLPFSTTSGVGFQLSPRAHDSTGLLAAGSFSLETISGAVYDDSTGLPLSPAVVVLVGKISENGFVLFFDFTDASGSYSFDNLPVLEYYALAWSPGYIAELYNDAHSIDSATLVTPPQSGVDFYLANISDGPWAISGEVKNLGTGLAGVIVNAVRPSGELAASAYTLPGSGAYTLEGLEPGTYTVGVSSYSGTALPQMVAVSEQDVNGVNFNLIAGLGTRGDVNTDGKITLGDAIYIVNSIFKPALFPPVPVSKGDVNCSGSVTLGDAIYLANYILKAGPAPCSSP
ncbi:MAG: hypothetical protein A2142_06100 [candidate division Zixibacteria bacterium RBG_16_48_11]|nr:MAG: hypothetical protein A2142_06100 [candidate division Zixibacteria bacterium RBG_16_48_11]